MTKKLYFNVEQAEVLDEDPLSQFATARIVAFSTGRSRHDTTCDAEALQRTAHTIYEKPIVFEYDSVFDDFGTHTRVPVISGFVVKNSAKFINQPDGRISLEVTAKIWKKYSKKFIDVFSNSGSNKRSVSVEIEVISSEEDENGLLKLIDWCYAAVCVLGTLVTPASPGAEIEMLSFSEKENKEYAKAFSEEFASRYDGIDFTIPKAVKSNAKQGLELREKYGRGGTSVGLASARYIVKNATATPEKVRHIAKYFPRHAGDNLDDKESNGWIAWQLWGGNAGRRWSASIVDKMDEADSKQMTYYSRSANIDNFSLTSAQILEILNSCLVETYKAGDIEYRRYWVETYDDDCVYIYDNQESHMYCASYVLDENAKTASINMQEKHRVIRGGYEVVDKNGKTLFASDNGTEKEIDVDKSKDSLSEDAWGSVDKVILKNRVLKAQNYKSLVNDVYLLVEDGWEEHPSSSLKYPVMQIKDGKLVYNRYGLASALLRAKGQDKDSVVKKVLSLYKKLGIDQSKEETETMADEEIKTETMAAPEEEVETPKEEAEETEQKEKEEQEKGEEKKFSLAAWSDTAAVLAFLEEETEDASEDAGKVRLAAEEMKKGDEADFGVVASGMYAKMCKMSAQMKACMAENDELKKFKAEIDGEKKDFAVSSTIKTLSEKFAIPEDVIQSMRESSKDFSFDKIDDWKNSVKAKAVDFAVITSNTEEDTVRIYAFPFPVIEKTNEDLWNN